ncbi:HET-domain-containing protein [Daldinia sp. FL1419]|nr:HET-domain-containing protein [Daldinia sp. FL1419]
MSDITNISMIYTPLGNMDVRLLTIESESQEPISCRLHRLPLTADTKYTALSYLWGDQNDKKIITIDGHRFPVGVSLYNALRDISKQRWFTKDIYFWVDAICINQDDNSEKSKQIPRMAQIYSWASRVIVSVIATDTLQDSDIELLSDLAGSLESIRDGIQPDETRISLDRSFGGNSWRKQPYSLLKKLFKLPWFSRIWVRQEVTLAVDWPTIILGKHQAHMLDLCNLWTIVSEDGYMFDQPQLMGLRDARMMIHNPAEVEEAGLSLGTAEFLLHVILAYGGAEATLPHDQVYGLLGQVYAFIEKTHGHPLPTQLSPDYTRPYEEVYHEFVAYIFESTGDLRLWETTARKFGVVPSWVPDLRYLGSNITFVPMPIKANLKLSKSRNELQVEGVRISTCQDILLPMSKISRRVSHLRDRINDLEEKIIKPSAAITNKPVEILRKELFDNVSKDYRPGQELYEKVLAFIAERENEDLSKYHIRNDDTSFKLLVLLDAIYILFQDGNTGICNRHDAVVERGDILCLFKGALRPSIIRSAEGGYTLIGSCKLTDSESISHDVRVDWFQRHHCEFFNLV